MKIQFADSFWESLDRLHKRNRWYNVLWRTVRYNIPNFLKNIWYFRKELYDFEAWDYRYNLNLFQRSLEATADYIEHQGIEENESRLKKVTKMRRVVQLMEQDKEDHYLKQAESELGARIECNWFAGEELSPEDEKHNRIVYKRADELDAEAWDELWDTFKGNKAGEHGIRGWWD